MIYLKSISELPQITNENYRQFSVKSVIRLYQRQTDRSLKSQAMGVALFLIGKRMRDYDVKVTFECFARYFLDQNISMHIDPESFHFFIDYGDFVAAFDFENSILTGLGSIDPEHYRTRLLTNNVS